MHNPHLDLHTKITVLHSWGADVLAQGEKASKEDLKEILLLGEEIHSLFSEGGGLFPLYLRALDRIRDHVGTLLFLSQEEVDEILSPEKRLPLSWWGIHYSEIYQEGLVPWAKTLEVTPVELYRMFPSGCIPAKMTNPDGSWNSNLSKEEILKNLR